MSTPYADADNKRQGSPLQSLEPEAAATEPASAESRWALLRRGRFLALWAGQLTGVIGDSFNYVAVAWLVLQLTGSSLAVGSVLATAAVPRGLLMLLGGAVNDRLSPRLTMVLSGLVRAVVMGVLAALALAHAVTLPELFIGSFLIGAISAFFIPAPPTLLPRVVEQHQLEAGNAMMQLNSALGAIVGPALAGIVVAAFGAGAALLGDAVGYAMAGVFALLVPGIVATATTLKKGSPLASIGEGIAFVWRDVPMRAAWVLIAVINLVILGALEVGIPVLAREQLQGPISFGIIFTALGLASTAGAVVAGSRKGPRRLGWLLLAGTAWMGLGVALIALAQTLPAVLVAMVAIGLAIGVLNTYLLSWVQRRVQPDMMGRVMSMVMLAGLGAEPIGLAAGGAIASRSLTLLLWLCAASIVAVAAAATMSRSVRQMS
jgi:MFS family permease